MGPIQDINQFYKDFNTAVNNHKGELPKKFYVHVGIDGNGYTINSTKGNDGIEIDRKVAKYARAQLKGSDSVDSNKLKNYYMQRSGWKKFISLFDNESDLIDKINRAGNKQEAKLDKLPRSFTDKLPLSFTDKKLNTLFSDHFEEVETFLNWTKYDGWESLKQSLETICSSIYGIEGYVLHLDPQDQGITNENDLKFLRELFENFKTTTMTTDLLNIDCPLNTLLISLEKFQNMILK